MTVLGTKGLSLGYGKVTVVDELDLDLPPGQVTAIVGPNGCGKSTLLGGLARIHAARSGAVLLDGVDIGRNCRVKRAIIDKNVRLPENTSVGLDAEQDRARGFTVTESGITVVGKGTVLEP